MARAVEKHWTGDASALTGLAVTRYGHGIDCERIKVIEAGHPLPDEAGRAAAKIFLREAAKLGKDDLLLCLISGGASALLVEPIEGLTLVEKQVITMQLLASGLPIGEINCIRKHLSAIKGGRLAAAAAPARVVTLAISDVPGDDPAVIGSGPTVSDPTSCVDALAIAEKRSIELPAGARNALKSGEWESVKPGDPRLRKARFKIVARPADGLAAAAATAERFGFLTTVLGDNLEGEARDLGIDHARLALAARPGALISGGETTVTVSRDGGRGGRNCEYLLALAVALDGAEGIHAIACDTDGIDGTSDAAGALITPDTLERARAIGLDARDYLDRHDSYGFFSILGDLIVTGPTRTNVNDFRAILIGSGGRA